MFLLLTSCVIILLLSTLNMQLCNWSIHIPHKETIHFQCLFHNSLPHRKLFRNTVSDTAYRTYHIRSSDCHHRLPLSSPHYSWNMSIFLQYGCVLIFLRQRFPASRHNQILRRIKLLPVGQSFSPFFVVSFPHNHGCFLINQ